MLARAAALSIKPLLEPLLAAVRCPPAAPFIVAVSGGGDSMALLLLAHESYPGRVHGVTVDHGLRAGSAAEAEKVARWSFAHGIPHRIVRWAGKKPATAIQKSARDARYGLLARAACETGTTSRPAPVLVAHTIEDQAETFIMRLAHGSDIAGLAAMHAVSEIAGAPPVPLLRPLLGISRAELRAHLRAHGQAWLEDPSNEDMRFERIRVREMIGAGLPSARELARAAALFGRLEKGVEPQVQELLREAVRIEPEGFARINKGALAGAHPVTLSRALSRLVRALGGGAYPPPRASIEALAARLRSAGFAGATLGGCRIIPYRQGLLLVREQRGVPRLPISPGTVAYWDRRFFVSLPPGGRALTIAPVGHFAAALRDQLGPHVPIASAAALPGLYEGPRLVAPAPPGPMSWHAPTSRFSGLARVERRLCREWATWVPAQISPTVS